MGEVQKCPRAKEPPTKGANLPSIYSIPKGMRNSLRNVGQVDLVPKGPTPPSLTPTVDGAGTKGTFGSKIILQAHSIYFK